ncbi:50S ribosomal protein L3 [Candidatus Ruminimicrobium bovinum]|uniref:50S ribosomal protein L3 n=1 Tax=Candidatus Ruminimicrobium bovinum TaxID=3242779 RepID=UPI0039B8764D
MNKAIIGKKLGMSQIFAPDGKVIPVTVIEAGPCPVVQKKTVDNDGYDALQVAFGEIKEKNVNKPMAAHFKKAGVTPKRVLKELRLTDCSAYEVGQEIKCDVFAEGDFVDVTGTTRGRGFSGTIQRWNTHRGPMAHGSGYHRGVGSLSSNSDPSRVFKNKKMPGQYGNEQVTIQNLLVAKVDAARNLLLVKGAIPGAKGSIVVVKQTVKA